MTNLTKTLLRFGCLLWLWAFLIITSLGLSATFADDGHRRPTVSYDDKADLRFLYDARSVLATGKKKAGVTEDCPLLGKSSKFLAAEGTAPNRIYSARELIRRAEEPGPFHNFPESFNQEVFSGTRTVVSSDYVLYTKPGTIDLPGKPIFGPNSVTVGGETVPEIIGYTPTRTVNEVYEIGVRPVRPSASGGTEVIAHCFFRTQ